MIHINLYFIIDKMSVCVLSISEIQNKTYELYINDKVLIGHITKFITEDGQIYELPLNSSDIHTYNVKSLFIKFYIRMRLNDTYINILKELYLSPFVLFITSYDSITSEMIRISSDYRDWGLTTLYALKDHTIQDIIIKSNTDIWNFKTLYPLGG